MGAAVGGPPGPAEARGRAGDEGWQGSGEGGGAVSVDEQWKAGEEQAEWSGDLEIEARRVAKAILRPVGICWRGGYRLVYLPSADAQGVVYPSGAVTRTPR